MHALFAFVVRFCMFQPPHYAGLIGPTGVDTKKSAMALRRDSVLTRKAIVVDGDLVGHLHWP